MFIIYKWLIFHGYVKLPEGYLFKKVGLAASPTSISRPAPASEAGTPWRCRRVPRLQKNTWPGNLLHSYGKKVILW